MCAGESYWVTCSRQIRSAHFIHFQKTLPIYPHLSTTNDNNTTTSQVCQFPPWNSRRSWIQISCSGSATLRNTLDTDVVVQQKCPTTTTRKSSRPLAIHLYLRRSSLRLVQSNCSASGATKTWRSEISPWRKEPIPSGGTIGTWGGANMMEHLREGHIRPSTKFWLTWHSAAITSRSAPQSTSPTPPVDMPRRDSERHNAQSSSASPTPWWWTAATTERSSWLSALSLTLSRSYVKSI